HHRQGRLPPCRAHELLRDGRRLLHELVRQGAEGPQHPPQSQGGPDDRGRRRVRRAAGRDGPRALRDPRGRSQRQGGVRGAGGGASESVTGPAGRAGERAEAGRAQDHSGQGGQLGPPQARRTILTRELTGAYGAPSPAVRSARSEDPMTDRLISCDDHMDLSQLPADLWTTRLPASLLDRCKAAPDRLIGLPMLPETPEGALAELERVRAKGGVRQVNLMIANINPKLDDPAWEPLWQALEDSGIILSWHITVFVGKPGDRVAGKAASVFENTKFFLANFLEPFVDLFAWGILERHPRLRMVMAEAGTGWLPWLVQELDYRHWRLWEAKEFWADKGGSALETKP